MNLSILCRKSNFIRMRKIIVALNFTTDMQQVCMKHKSHTTNYKRLDLKFLEYLENPMNSDETLSLNKSHTLDDQQFVKCILLEKNDLKLSNKINELSVSEVFTYLGLVMRMKPGGAFTHTNFYNESMKILQTRLKRDQLSVHETLKLLFFAGLKKKNGAHEVKLIVKYLPSFNKLSLMEQSIVADTLFKCAIKFNKLQGRIIEEIIEQNAELLIKDAYLLVPFCKAVRHIGPTTKFTMENLSRALLATKEQFEIPFCAHIASLYAEAYLKNTQVLSRLFNDSFSQISSEYSRIRLKDIDRLLWSARILNYQFEKNEINAIIQFIHENFDNFQTNNVILVNILLSLWMLGYKSKELIIKCFDSHIFESILEDESLWKPTARLQLLLTCIRHEAPEISIPQALVKSHKVGLKINKNVRKLFRQVDSTKDQFKLEDLEINCPIVGIYIPGVSFKHNNCRNYHIDLLDEHSCLRRSHEPHGLMKLKLRLLNRSGWQSILIDDEYIDNDEMLRDRLAEDLKLK